MRDAWHTHAIFEGQVAHCRLQPKRHAFRYPMSFVYLNLEHVEEAFAGHPGWSCDRPNVAWFRREDHLGDIRKPLVEAVRELVGKSGNNASGPVCLLTQLRYWGFIMNPVSFYFCFNSSGDGIAALVAEVHNTPWGERHCYVLSGEKMNEVWLDKQFHVSPFLPLDMQYRFRITPPAESLSLEIDNFQDGEQTFAATLKLTRRPWTAPNLRRVLWRYPFQTHAVYAAIYWQALQLWIKGTPYFPHPNALSDIHR